MILEIKEIPVRQLQLRLGAGGGDLIPPTVSSVSPSNGATGVSVNTTVIANFSEAVSSASVTSSTYQLRNSQPIFLLMRR